MHHILINAEDFSSTLPFDVIERVKLALQLEGVFHIRGNICFGVKLERILFCYEDHLTLTVIVSITIKYSISTKLVDVVKKFSCKLVLILK